MRGAGLAEQVAELRATLQAARERRARQGHGHDALKALEPELPSRRHVALHRPAQQYELRDLERQGLRSKPWNGRVMMQIDGDAHSLRLR